MAQHITIPKANEEHSNFPCWVGVVDTEDNNLKPMIICNCGELTSIGLHHVHADGKVTRSYWHHPENNAGCGWHVYLTLENYDNGVFIPVKK